MKGVKLCIMSLLVLLAGCGGGGGGGGGGGSLPPPDPIAANEYAIFAAPPVNVTGSTIEQDGNPDNPADDYVFVRRNGNKIIFTYRDLPNRDVLGNHDSMRTFEVSTGSGAPDTGSFQNSTGGMKAEVSDTQQINNQLVAGKLVNGTYTVTNTIEVGGKKMGLSYADFGMWKTKSTFNGTIAGTAVNRMLMHEPEMWSERMEDRSRRAYFTSGIGNAKFEGKAMGVARAHNGGDDVGASLSAEIYGDAIMNIDLASRRASLDLNFANFYNFRFENLGIDQRGEFEEIDGVSSMSFSDNSNNTQVTLDNDPVRQGFDVEGQFYGPAPHDPSEAVGEAEIKQIKSSGDNRYVEIDIAFGMKEKP